MLNPLLYNIQGMLCAQLQCSPRAHSEPFLHLLKVQSHAHQRYFNARERWEKVRVEHALNIIIKRRVCIERLNYALNIWAAYDCTLNQRLN